MIILVMIHQSSADKTWSHVVNTTTKHIVELIIAHSSSEFLQAIMFEDRYLKFKYGLVIADKKAK